MSCIRCSECAGADHHWLDNGDFGADPDDAEHPTGNSHVCKHCDAVGDECEECDGYGEIEGGDGVGRTCPDCEGAGVLLSVPKSYEEL